jgi:hypothetical protein
LAKDRLFSLFPELKDKLWFNDDQFDLEKVNSGVPLERNKLTQHLQGRDLLFKAGGYPRTALFKDTTLCIVKPHAINHGELRSPLTKY